MVENQDLEALWSVVFLTPNSQRINAGVVVFESERIFGGDSWFYYTGTYKGEKGKLVARVKSTHYFGSARFTSDRHAAAGSHRICGNCPWHG